MTEIRKCYSKTKSGFYGRQHSGSYSIRELPHPVSSIVNASEADYFLLSATCGSDSCSKNPKTIPLKSSELHAWKQLYGDIREKFKCASCPSSKAEIFQLHWRNKKKKRKKKKIHKIKDTSGHKIGMSSCLPCSPLCDDSAADRLH